VNTFPPVQPNRVTRVVGMSVGKVLKYGVIMLACIPSAKDACEHDYSVFQQIVPFMVEMSREYDEWSWVRILRELMHARSMARRASGHYMPVKLGNLWLDVGTSTREVVVGSNPQGVNACAKHGKTR
jgi:hypothetical protein